MMSAVSVSSPSASSPKQEVEVIDLCDSISPQRFRPRKSAQVIDDGGTPMRPVFCVKSKEAMKEIEKKEDCFILDFDPDDYEPSSIGPKNPNDAAAAAADASPDIIVVAEKGQVACRDYPHSRHLCIKFPFAQSSHENYCKQCFCFVCDQAAPCKEWNGDSGHCHAIDNEAWKLERKKLHKTKKSQRSA